MSRFLLVILLMDFVACGSVSSNVSSQTQAQQCMPAGSLVRLQGVSEASGAAASQRHPGIIWTHNDSGEPVVFAFDTRGGSKGRVTITGATVTDWEDVAVAPCPQGSCLYIADIGDNNRARRQITIYRVAEPALDAQATSPAEAITLTYPDGARDAEALFIARGELFIVSKTNPQTTALYRAALTARTGTLTAVTRLPLAGVTGGSISPDGEWVALRTNEELMVYRAEELASGQGAEPRRFALMSVGEPQGEGVAIGADGVIYLVGEGGGGGGTLAAIRCPLR
jgi:hypothetical protein